MATKKKNNSRKALAVALGVMGVAGLSLASASQLTVNTTSANVAVGQGTFAAACDTAVDVAFVPNIASNNYGTLTISDIDAACGDGEQLLYTVNITSSANVASTVTGTIPANLGTSATVSLAAVPLSSTVNSIDVTIY